MQVYVWEHWIPSAQSNANIAQSAQKQFRENLRTLKIIILHINWKLILSILFLFLWTDYHFRITRKLIDLFQPESAHVIFFSTCATTPRFGKKYAPNFFLSWKSLILAYLSFEIIFEYYLPHWKQWENTPDEISQKLIELLHWKFAHRLMTTTALINVLLGKCWLFPWQREPFT